MEEEPSDPAAARVVGRALAARSDLAEAQGGSRGGLPGAAGSGHAGGTAHGGVPVCDPGRFQFAAKPEERRPDPGRVGGSRRQVGRPGAGDRGAKGQLMAQLPCMILAAELALAGNDRGAALDALQIIAERMKKDSSRTTADLACHAALMALETGEPAVTKAALGVLDAAAKGLETAGQPEPLGSLLLLLARRYFEQGDAASGRSRLEAYLQSSEKTTVRYTGDYPLFIRKQQLEQVAGEYARAGLWSDALAALGRFVDAPAYSGGDPPVQSTLLQVLARIQSRPAGEQYQTLHAWTMPEKDRRMMRMLRRECCEPERSADLRASRRQLGERSGSDRESSDCGPGRSRGTEHHGSPDRGGAAGRHAREAGRGGPRRGWAQDRQADRKRPGASSAGRAGPWRGCGRGRRA